MSFEPTFLSFRALIAPSLVLAPLIFLNLITANEFPRQQPFSYHGEGEFRVGIIGAGIAGASAAYHLHTSGPLHGRPIAITIFESSDEVGGQVKTVSPPGYEGRRFKPLELGASFFWDDDWCLMDAAQATQTVLLQTRDNRRTGDGRWMLSGSHLVRDRFCEKTDLRLPSYTWREVKRIMGRTLDWLSFEWTHGFLPWRIRRRLKTHLEQFGDFGRNRTFDNVMQELERCGLGHEVVSNTASSFLESLDMTQDLQRTFLEPCMKEAYGLSSEEALGLHTVLSAGVIRSNVSVVATDGNQRFIERLIEKSEATVRLNSRIVRVEAGSERRYALTVTSNEDGEENVHSEFEAIIATGDALQSLGPRASPKQQITTLKTYFSSEYDLDPTAIGVKADSVPHSLLFATREESYRPHSDYSPLHLTSLNTYPSFYIDRTGCSGDDECDQFVHVYVAESTRSLSRDDLSRLMRKREPISWSTTHSWQRNLPVANSSSPSFGDVQVEEFLFNAENTVLDSLEMSCRMGRNIALKIMEQPLGAEENFGKSSSWTESDLLSNVQGLL